MFAQLRRDLLEDYDRGSYPWESAWNTSTTEKREGVPVELGINFHKVYSVDITNSAADLVVWVRQRWVDPRLSWDPKDYDGVTKTWFWIGDGSGSAGDMSEIWTPDLELWNLDSSLSQSLVDTHAQVSFDGMVFWSRPGHIKPVCKFDGLNEFPFDRLDCSMELGSWGFSGLYLRPIKFGGTGFSIGGSDTAGEAYAEYSLEDVSCEEHLYPPYLGAPEEDWPVIFYHLAFKRAWQPYARGYIPLQIILNVAAFCCFWLPPHIGERMSLAITSMLAAVASELVVSANLPPASEITWVAKFSLVSLMFAALTLFESAAVIYFYYHTGSSLVPRWATWLKGKVRRGSSDQENQDSGVPIEDSDNVSSTGSSPNNFQDIEQAHSSLRPRRDMKVTFTKDIVIDELVDSEDGDACNDESDKTKEPSVVLDRISHLAGHHGLSFHRKITGSTRKSIKTILGRDADDFKNAQELENNLQWQKIASNIDNTSRVVFPAAYAVFLSWALAHSN